MILNAVDGRREGGDKTLLAQFYSAARDWDFCHETEMLGNENGEENKNYLNIRLFHAFSGKGRARLHVSLRETFQRRI